MNTHTYEHTRANKGSTAVIKGRRRGVFIAAVVVHACMWARATYVPPPKYSVKPPLKTSPTKLLNISPPCFTTSTLLLELARAIASTTHRSSKLVHIRVNAFKDCSRTPVPLFQTTVPPSSIPLRASPTLAVGIGVSQLADLGPDFSPSAHMRRTDLIESLLHSGCTCSSRKPRTSCRCPCNNQSCTRRRKRTSSLLQKCPCLRCRPKRTRRLPHACVSHTYVRAKHMCKKRGGGVNKGRRSL